MARSEDVERVFNEHQRFEVSGSRGSLGTRRAGRPPR
jgi:hypothetical protein